MGLSELTCIFVFALLAGAVAVLVWRSSRSARKLRETGPVCGQCAYPVRGVTTFTCPECGCDYRNVGILSPAISPGYGPTSFAIAWTLIIFVIGLFVVPLVSTTLGPRVLTAESSYSYRPSSGAYRFSTTLASRAVVWPWQRDEVDGDLAAVTAREFLLSVDDGRAVEIRAHSSSDEVTILGPGTASTTVEGPPGVEIVLDRYAALGIDTTDAQIQAEATEVTNLIARAIGGVGLDGEPDLRLDALGRGASTWSGSGGGGARLTNFQGSGSWSSGGGGPSPWVAAILALVFLVIWIIGLRRIFQRESP
ncbi:MAG: hypothetical protein ACF8PN_09220 [Phycisphaerales bacterium]